MGDQNEIFKIFTIQIYINYSAFYFSCISKHISIVSTLYSRSTVSSTTYEFLNSITDSASGKIKGETERQFLLLKALAETDFMKSNTLTLREKCAQLSRIAKVDPSYENIGFYNLSGESYTSAGQYIKIERDYIKGAAEGKSYILDPAINPITNVLFQIFTYPVYDTNKKPIGCIAANVYGETLSHRIEQIKFGSEKATLQVVNRDTGLTVASTVIQEVERGQSVKEGLALTDGIGPILQALLDGKTGSQFFKDTKSENQELCIGAYRPIPGTNWSVLCVCPYEDFYSSLGKMTVTNTITLISVVIIVGLIMFFVCKKAFSPLKKVQTAIEDIASGDADLTKKLDANSNDEVGEIVKSFNNFTENLRTIIDQIKDSKNTLGVAGSDLKANTEDTTSSITEIIANIESVHKQHGDIPLRKAFQQVPVRRFLRRPAAFHDQAVHRFLQHPLQDVPLRLHVVVHGVQRKHRAVLVQHGFHSLGDGGEDVIRNEGCDHADMDDALPPARSVPHIGAAPPPPVHQAVVLQQGDRLPDRLPGDVKAHAEFFLRHQRLSVPEDSLRDFPPQRIRHLQILRLFSHGKHIPSSRGCPHCNRQL